MRKTLLAAALASAATLAVSAQYKINHTGHRILEDFKAERLATGDANDDPMTAKPLGLSSDPTYSAIVLLDDADSLDRFADLGYDISFARNDVVVARIPLADMERLAEYDFVRNISFGETVRPSLNLARQVSNVDPVQAGQSGLPSAFTGKGVVTSLFDTGLDPNHIDFKDADGNLRVTNVGVWNNNGFSTDYVGETEISRFSTEAPSETHGTHVLGIMSGSYNGPSTYAGSQSKREGNMPFYGVATGSDIIVTCGSLYTANILDAVSYILEEAPAEKPVVVNLSLGNNNGSHDPNSAFNRALDELGEQAIICVAAGNEGDANIGVMKTFTADDTTLKTFIEPSNYSATGMNGLVEFYSSNKNALKFSVVIYDTRRNNILYELPVNASLSGKSVYLAGASYKPEQSYNRNEYFDQAFSPDSYLSISTNVETDINRYAIYVQPNLKYTSSSDDTYILGFIIEGDPGVTVNGYGTPPSSSGASYTMFSDGGVKGWTEGTPNGTISDMACGNNVVAIGSYNSRVSWYLIGSGPYSYLDENPDGDISSFSSYGTLYDGRNLPVVCAPGACIMSAMSLFYYNTLKYTEAQTVGYYTSRERPNYWMNMQGTSMASPFAAGVYALWLEADPTLNVADIIDITKATARRDTYVDNGNQVQWGAGKLDALAGIKEVIKRAAGLGSVFADPDQRLIINPLDYNLYNVFVEAEDAIDVHVYNAAGSEVMRVNGDSNDITVDVSDLLPGVYVLAVEGQCCHRYAEKIYVR